MPGGTIIGALHREIALACPLVGAGAELEGHCAWCGRSVGGFRTTWCGRRHEVAWWKEHVWSEARPEALRRAAPDGKAVDARCVRCGASDQSWRTCWQPSTGKYAACADEACERHHYLRRRALQVDHIDPRQGHGYDAGCWNHQSNLQVLCIACHAITGIVRRRVAEAFTRAGVKALPAGPMVEPLELWS